MKQLIHLLKITITAMAVICVLSCDDNLKAIQKMQIASNEPMGEVKEMLLKHTDSGLIKVKMSGETMLDFSNDIYPYTEFPNGIHVVVYEHKKDSVLETNITADYAIMYSESDLVDLKGNVTIVNHDGNTFHGEQLYWDQTAKWIFTDQSFSTQLKNASTSGTMLDADEEYNKITVRDNNDQFYRTPLKK
ncbi:hypothetical protein JCM19314_3249 [Nonlabens ulvanivorans]|uniref:LPS export ABC transporter periplasmic protein LptC n=1 Tax=Nonlabens ulvanivorans TaxID=906888 RepID=A0A090QBP3_NONUL|nr:LPS export ABC transporter periplasmic protein LptC [Nonlabens ulvanivorans]GAK99218.1 hypothetical protein JCM19314_3249 [Nonlabens ulvanivorans]